MKGAIILIGPSGAGKSEVGAALAERLGRPFVDTDQIVERNAKSQIAAIFSSEGEAGFREREELAVAEAVRVPGAVISAGGGAVTSGTNSELLERAGVVVYLEVDAKTAASRVGDDTTRPLVTGGDPEVRLSELIAAREGAYKAIADHIVGANGDLDEVVDRVLKLIAP